MLYRNKFIWRKTLCRVDRELWRRYYYIFMFSCVFFSPKWRYFESYNWMRLVMRLWDAAHSGNGQRNYHSTWFRCQLFGASASWKRFNEVRAIHLLRKPRYLTSNSEAEYMSLFWKQLTSSNLLLLSRNNDILCVGFVSLLWRQI